MKKYVILTTNVGAIGGAQIHNRNKMKYCEELGWKVYVITHHYAKVLIEELIPFEDCIVEELGYFPDMFPERRQREVMENVLSMIDFHPGDNVVFECHLMNLACWAEIISKEIHGKNFVYLLSEKFSERTVLHIQDFLTFKYNRRELATISRPETMQQLFNPIRKLQPDECYTLYAASWNEAEDVEIPKRIDLGNECDVTIGILGRSEKVFVLKALKEIECVAKEHSDKTFKIIIMGGPVSDQMVDRYISSVNMASITYVKTGGLYPIPKELLHMLDVCISSAGSARVAGRETLTILMDTQGEAIGIMGYDTMSTLINDNEQSKSLREYLEMILFTDFKDTAQYNLVEPLDHAECVGRLEKQMEFIQNSEQSEEYFDFEKMPSGVRELFCRMIYSVMGIRGLRLAGTIRNSTKKRIAMKK